MDGKNQQEPYQHQHQQQPKPPGWFRGFIQGKTRVATAWIFAVIVVLSARRYPDWSGILLCFNGATLRFWASGYLKKDSTLATGGPYAYVRNPLYLGTYLMAIGTVAAIGNFWLFFIITILFAVIYHFIILDEENKLHRIFGDSYVAYCRAVPRFFPRLLPARREMLLAINKGNKDQDTRRFSWDIAWRNRAYEAYGAFAGLIGFVTLSAFIWQRWMSVS